MKSAPFGSKYFVAKEINNDIVLLKVNVPYFSENNMSFFNNSTSLLIDKGYKNLIIDLSETEYLDSSSVTMIIQKMTELALIGGSVKLVVGEEQPRLTFSVGNDISKIGIYLTLENALNEMADNSIL